MDFISMLVAAPAILAVVNLCKNYGLPSKWAPVVSILAGGVLGAIASYLQTGGFDALPAHILMGLVTGLTASGVYDVAVTVGTPGTHVEVQTVENKTDVAAETANISVSDVEPE